MLVAGRRVVFPFGGRKRTSRLVYTFYFQDNTEIIMSNQNTFLVCGFLSPWQAHISLCPCCSLGMASNPILGFTPSSMFSHKHLCHISHTGRIKYSLYRLTLFALSVRRTYPMCIIFYPYSLTTREPFPFKLQHHNTN